MKIKCITKTLQQSLNNAEYFTGKNLDLPVLSCIVLETKNNFLEISSTNINTAYKNDIPVNVAEDGKVAVFGDVLSKAISNIKDDEIELTVENNILKITSEKNNIELNTVDFNDFPTILDIDSIEEEAKILEIKSQDFLNGLNSTIYSTSKSNIKPELASIFFNTRDDKIIFAATDGFRLAEKIIKKEKSDLEFSMLIPNESAVVISKILTSMENQKVDIYFYGKQFFIKSDSYTVFSRLTEGNFVDYQKLIPTEIETSLIILKQDFLETSKLVNLFSDDFNQIKITVSDKIVSFETKNTFGKNLNIIDAVVSGSDLEMSFNHKNILDSFNSINTDSVEFIFNTGKPLLIKAVGDNSFKYIVMPLSK
jgi:DNA polymerase-3 subunit beta